jgi:hypothetical protein
MGMLVDLWRQHKESMMPKQPPPDANSQ